MNNNLTILIPSSPIPSHPSTEILDETISDIRKCSVDGCEKESKCKGMCNAHYSRVKKYGNPHTVKYIKNNNEARVLSHVDKNENGCWLWKGYTQKDGYGMFFLKGKVSLVHRWSYMYYKGDIPENLEVDHVCRVRNCINPAHLQLLTRADNMSRAISLISNRTHCKKGHELTPENIRNNSNGSKRCRQCYRDGQKVYREKKKNGK